MTRLALIAMIGLTLGSTSAASMASGGAAKSLWYRLSIVGNSQMTQAYSDRKITWTAKPAAAVLLKRLPGDDFSLTTPISASVTSMTGSGYSITSDISRGNGSCLYKWTEKLDGKPVLRGSASATSARLSGVTLTFPSVADRVVSTSKQVQCGSYCAGDTCKNPRPPSYTKDVVVRQPLMLYLPGAYVLRVRSDYKYGGQTYVIQGSFTSTLYGKSLAAATLTFKRCVDQSAGRRCT